MCVVLILLLCVGGSFVLGDAEESPLAEDLAEGVQCPQAWKAQPTVVYGPENVYEKIDGRDQTYLAFGLVCMANAIFGAESGADGVDIEIYDMGKPEHALGVFAQQHRGPKVEYEEIDGAETINLGVQLVCWKSRFYIKIDRAERRAANQDEGALVATLARQIASMIPRSADGAALVAPLPKKGMVAHSAGFTHSAYLGHDVLTDVRYAAYTEDGRTVVLFTLAPDDAQHVLQTVEKAEQSASRITGIGDEGIRVVREYIGAITMIRVGAVIIGSVDADENAGITDLLREFARHVR